MLVPPHGLSCATAYDDQGHLTPSRVLRQVEGLGYRGSLNVELSRHSHMAPEVMRESFDFLSRGLGRTP